MNRIVERCPSCGVEHDEPTHECEACGSPVRYWCRTHSRETGWLETAECSRCTEEEARRVPRARPAAVSVRPARGRRTRAAPPLPSMAPAAKTVDPELPERHTAKLPEVPRERARPATVVSGIEGALLRVFEAVLTLLWAMIVCILIGVGAGAVYAFAAGADVPVTAVEWGVYGGLLGTLIGFFAAFGPYIFADVPSRKRRWPWRAS